MKDKVLELDSAVVFEEGVQCGRAWSGDRKQEAAMFCGAG